MLILKKTLKTTLAFRGLRETAAALPVAMVVAIFEKKKKRKAKGECDVNTRLVDLLIRFEVQAVGAFSATFPFFTSGAKTATVAHKKT